MRRFLRYLCVAWVISLLLVPFQAHAQEAHYIDFSQVELCPPQAVAYFYLCDQEGNPVDDPALTPAQIGAQLGDKALTVDSIERQRDSVHGVAYYYLLDLSNPVPYAALEAVKSHIVSHIAEKRAQDRIIVFACGDEVQMVLRGNEGAQEAGALLDDLKATQQNFRLYDALAAVSDLVDESDLDERDVIFLCAASARDSGSKAGDEALTRLSSAGLHLYSFSYSGSKSALAEFGTLSRLSAREPVYLQSYNAQRLLEESVEYIGDAFRLQARAVNNATAQGPQTFLIQIRAEEWTVSGSLPVAAARWIPDTTPPQVTGVEVTGEYQLVAHFSEPVLGAGNAANYRLMLGRLGRVRIARVTYDSETCTATLTTLDRLYKGNYTLTLYDIREASMDQNPIESTEISFHTDTVARGFRYLLERQYSLLILLAALLAAGWWIYSRRKKTQEQARRAQRLLGLKDAPVPDAPHLDVHLRIAGPDGSEREVDADIGGCYIIGRNSATCDLALDDPQAARQHAVLAYRGGRLLLQDLYSAAGTQLNGTQLKQAAVLKDGDVITIGARTITVSDIRESAPEEKAAAMPAATGSA